MEISYRTDITPTSEQIIELYQNSGLPRPTEDVARIKKMYEHSSLIVTAWVDDQLIGVARSLTDFCWCCYLADLAVRKDYQSHGIGRKLIAMTKESIGEESMLLLLSVPTAMKYYPKVGFVKQESSFIMNRTR